MMCVKKHIATNALAGLVLSVTWTGALAGQAAGTVSNLSGPLMVKKADGAVRVLALRSVVEQGDTLVAEKNTYAQIRFTDNSEMTLRPETTVTIDAFAYDGAKPEEDDAKFTLVKGGLRWTTGLMGQRSKGKFALVTPTATVGVRGTTFVAQFVGAGGVPPTPGSVRPPGSGGPTPPGTSSLPPGLYLTVIDGLINVTNQGGTTGFSAGQFGFVRTNITPPIFVPINPGLMFTPPPSFSSPTQSAATNNPPKAQAIDCEVR